VRLDKAEGVWRTAQPRAARKVVKKKATRRRR